MQTVTTIGLDIAKSVFQVQRVDAAGHVVIRRRLKRRTVLAFFPRNKCSHSKPGCRRSVAIRMSEQLPQMVDQLTPHGRLPTEEDCSGQATAHDTRQSL